jgi:hypothetical protein
MRDLNEFLLLSHAVEDGSPIGGAVSTLMEVENCRGFTIAARLHQGSDGSSWAGSTDAATIEVWAQLPIVLPSELSATDTETAGSSFMVKLKTISTTLNDLAGDGVAWTDAGHGYLSVEVRITSASTAWPDKGRLLVWGMQNRSRC